MRRFPVLGALLLASPLLALASAGPFEQTGVFALLGGTPKIVSKFHAEHRSSPSAMLEVRQFQPDGKTPILDYTIDMQKTMHMIVIRDDFATFDHLHPAYDLQTGVFSTPFAEQAGRKYYVYADSIPHGAGQQVFRFTMAAPGPLAASQPSLAVSPPVSDAGEGYSVTLSTVTLATNADTKLDVEVRQGGKPARDLTPFLGVAAHAVFINTSSLAYVHLHPLMRGQAMPTPMPSMSMEQQMDAMESVSHVGPYMRIDVPPLPAGIYKMWVQFKGGVEQHTHTAPFTLVAR